MVLPATYIEFIEGTKKLLAQKPAAQPGVEEADLKNAKLYQRMIMSNIAVNVNSNTEILQDYAGLVNKASEDKNVGSASEILKSNYKFINEIRKISKEDPHPTKVAKVPKKDKNAIKWTFNRGGHPGQKAAIDAHEKLSEMIEPVSVKVINMKEVQDLILRFTENNMPISEAIAKHYADLIKPVPLSGTPSEIIDKKQENIYHKNLHRDFMKKLPAESQAVDAIKTAVIESRGTALKSA